MPLSCFASLHPSFARRPLRDDGVFFSMLLQVSFWQLVLLRTPQAGWLAGTASGASGARQPKLS